MPPALRGFLGMNMKWTVESDIVLSLKKGGKKKKKQGTKQNMFTISCSCVSSRHDEHCAFLVVCGLKFFTVLAQFVGVNVSSLLKLI